LHLASSYRKEKRGVAPIFAEQGWRMNLFIYAEKKADNFLLTSSSFES
jgi:hypothetical protein